jgi:predicted ATP-dependent endonuclease of OLD family
MLKDLDVDLEDDLSLVIGKNNSGKTSLLAILGEFLGGKKSEFTLDDFNIETQEQIYAYESSSFTPEDYTEIALSLKLYISYTDSDNIGEASELLLDLDVSKHMLVVLFEYVLEYEKYIKLILDYNDYKKKINRDFPYFVSKNIKKYFRVRISALEFDNESNSKIISDEVIKSVISMQTIGARRDVANDEGRSTSLSLLAYKYYNASIASDLDFPELHKQLLDTDDNLSKEYQAFFSPVIDEIKEMSYNPHEAEILIKSSLSEKKIFQDNTIVKYKHDATLLPEDYNGLGYLNLFAIIFNIRIKLDQFSKKKVLDEKPTPINLLFIEEPEAHTHPQMQYVFIKKIKTLLKRHSTGSDKPFSLQTIISTHSSHIVSQCNFNDIKYFHRESSTSIKSRSLKTLYSKMITATVDPEKMKQELFFKFVKQYVTLNRAELFFADKAVLIEGDTERMLLSAMMRRHDKQNETKKDYLPLLSQNVSVIEVGAYAQAFAIFLGFIGIKTLILTDLDCAKLENGHLKKCRCSESETTTNSSIKYFVKQDKIQELTQLSADQLTFRFDDPSWVPDQHGLLRISFQKEENGYQARSFEDAYLSINLPFVVDNKEVFSGLKNRKKIVATANDYYDLAENCIESKTSFALDVLLYSGEDDNIWETPQYIREGLDWLAK